MAILVDNVSIIPMAGEAELIEKGYLVIKDNRIQALGDGRAPEASYDQVIDGSNKVALPGFINSHTHAAMTLLRGYADDLPLKEWLETRIWPLENKLTSQDIYWGTMLAILEMIKSGTTTFADMYFYMDQVAKAVEETGIRAVLSRGMVGVGPESEQAITESRALVERWHRAANERITFMLGPHAPYTCPPDYLQKVIKLADELGVAINIHLAETRGEFEDIKEQYGKTPVGLMEELGLFERRVLAAHCVHLTQEDITILKNYKVGVAHNPESNMKLASGIAPVPEMLEAGITVALGTDGASSNNNLDMLQEMRTGALLHKVNQMKPTVIPAYQALQMATINGARALGLGNEVGQLTPGFKADIILVDLKSANMTPRYDLVANLVYSAQAADVDSVIIDGKIIMQNREILAFNEQEILQQARRVAERLVG